jgi:hypothetical protein
VAKSYKICSLQFFDDSNFQREPFRLQPQYTLPKVAASPQTTIFKARNTIELEDFRSYLIEHEHEVSMYGRVNEHSFSKFIRKGFIHAYQSPARGLILLSGKKSDVLDFCRATVDLPEIKLRTLRIDMKALLAKLLEVKLVWFRFPAGMIRASALMGDHLEKTSDFERSKVQGDISTLSFYVQDATDHTHPILVTDDGTVVLQDLYDSIANEIELVLHVKAILLDGIYAEEQIRRSRTKR